MASVGAGDPGLVLQWGELGSAGDSSLLPDKLVLRLDLPAALTVSCAAEADWPGAPAPDTLADNGDDRAAAADKPAADWLLFSSTEDMIIVGVDFEGDSGLRVSVMLGGGF